MKTEKSCGAVVFTREGGLRYCVIRQINGDYGFPKGHMEPGETEQETALREIFEEAGLQVTLINGFRQELTYRLPRKPGCMKNTVYFLAEYAGQTPVRQPEEVTDIFEMTYDRAMERITFADLRQILTQADNFIRKTM